MEQYKSCSVFVMNHICHFDWLYFWGVVEQNGDITCWKAITKNMIRKVPLIGKLVMHTVLGHTNHAHCVGSL